MQIIASAASANCEKWFEKSKIKPGKDCLVECASFPVDMGTFDCPSSCADFCKTARSEKWIFELSDLYPGLTAEEKALAAQSPAKVLQAYQLSWKAEKLCSQLYRTGETNDESDACRHFVWSALLYKEFGTDFSGQVLNAHEQDAKQPEPEKAMDLANNRLGQIVAEKLVREKKFKEENLLNVFKDNLNQGRLIVLRKRGGN